MSKQNFKEISEFLLIELKIGWLNTLMSLDYFDLTTPEEAGGGTQKLLYSPGWRWSDWLAFFRDRMLLFHSSWGREDFSRFIKRIGAAPWLSD